MNHCLNHLVVVVSITITAAVCIRIWVWTNGILLVIVLNNMNKLLVKELADRRNALAAILNLCDEKRSDRIWLANCHDGLEQEVRNTLKTIDKVTSYINSFENENRDTEYDFDEQVIWGW